MPVDCRHVTGVRELLCGSPAVTWAGAAPPVLQTRSFLSRQSLRPLPVVVWMRLTRF